MIVIMPMFVTMRMAMAVLMPMLVIVRFVRHDRLLPIARAA
jgi:hypothetical protein